MPRGQIIAVIKIVLVDAKERKRSPSSGLVTKPKYAVQRQCIEIVVSRLLRVTEFNRQMIGQVTSRLKTEQVAFMMILLSTRTIEIIVTG